MKLLKKYPEFIPIIGVFIAFYNTHKNKNNCIDNSELLFYSSAFIQALSYFILYIIIYNYVK